DGMQSGQCSFELAHIGGHFLRDQMRHIFRQREFFESCFALQYGNSGLEVRRLQIGSQSPREASLQAFLDAGNLLRNLVRRDDDLMLRAVESIEGMEEFLLRTLFA